jgi:methyltransferase (TIGR00027 family)
MSMTPVGITSRWIAASRALETESDAPLFRDPLARALAGDAGFAMMDAMKQANPAVRVSGPEPYLSIRTRFFDDAIIAAVRESNLSQAVLVAAGMDARAFRLDWPEGMTVFEVDRDDVFEQKEPLLAHAGAQPRCARRIVRADVSDPWAPALADAGFDATQPAAFLVEGLLFYLPEHTAAQVIRDISALAQPGSWIGLDAVNTELIASPYFASYLNKLRELACPWQFGIQNPEQFMAAHGWEVTTSGPGDAAANYGRWPYPVVPRSIPGWPRTFLICGRRADAIVTAADSPPVTAPAAVMPVRHELVREDGVVGSFACPPGAGPFPAVLALGGSDGGLPEYFSDLLLPEGIACLALGYFGMDGLGTSLTDVPLERIEQGLRWLARQPRAKGNGGRVAVIGASRGAELALLVAARYPDLVGPVVAYTPSHVVWPGIDYTSVPNQPPASWTHQGRPLPHMEYVHGVMPTVSTRGLSMVAIGDKALDDGRVTARAAIPIERASGPLLLISGGDDQIWPAARMSRLAVERMRAHGRENDIVHLHYPEAGHGLFPYRPPSGTSGGMPLRLDLGGTLDALRAAHADAWPRVVEWLKGVRSA